MNTSDNDIVAEYLNYLRFWNEQAIINLVAYEDFLKHTSQRVLSPEERQMLYNFECRRLENKKYE